MRSLARIVWVPTLFVLVVACGDSSSGHDALGDLADGVGDGVGDLESVCEPACKGGLLCSDGDCVWCLDSGDCPVDHRCKSKHCVHMHECFPPCGDCATCIETEDGARCEEHACIGCAARCVHMYEKSSLNSA